MPHPNLTFQALVASLSISEQNVDMGSKLVRVLLHQANGRVDGLRKGHLMHAEVSQGNWDVVPLLWFERSHVGERQLLLLEVIVECPVTLPFDHAA